MCSEYRPTHFAVARFDCSTDKHSKIGPYIVLTMILSESKKKRWNGNLSTHLRPQSSLAYSIVAHKACCTLLNTKAYPNICRRSLVALHHAMYACCFEKIKKNMTFHYHPSLCRGQGCFCVLLAVLLSVFVWG